MASIRDLKDQIESLKNTAQITEAMQMVSASKMKKAQEAALNAIPYSEGIYEVVNKLGSITDYESPYLRKSEDIKNIAIVVIGTSRGFVGGQITNLISKTYNLSKDLEKKHKNINIRGISLHKTGKKILENAGINPEYHFADFIENPNTTNLSGIFNLIVDKFGSGEYDEVYIIYTHFINTIIQKTETKKILPLSIEEIIKEAAESDEDIKINTGFKFEPTQKFLLDRILPEYFQTQIFTALLESIASEHSARMVAMKNATDNAKDLTGKITLQYNRQRQAEITQQIIEVVSGSGIG